MEASNTPTISPATFALKQGLLYGGLGIAYLLIMYFTKKLETGKNAWSILLYLVTGIGTAIAIKKYRNRQLGGYITFGKTYGICLQVYLYAAIITASFFFILATYIAPDIPAHIERNGATFVTITSEDDNDTARQVIKLLASPTILSTIQLLNFILVGAVAGLIIAPICRKEKEVLPQESTI